MKRWVWMSGWSWVEGLRGCDWKDWGVLDEVSE